MSYYTSNIKSVIIDPQFDASLFRTEYRLGTPNTLYSSDLRLHGIGATVSEATAEGPVRFNLQSGANSIIRSMTLYSGAVVLDQITNFSDWAAFKGYNNTNATNTEQKTLSRAGLGFIYHRDTPKTVGVADVRQPALIKESCPDMGSQLGVVRNYTPTGMLFLKKVFPLLGEMGFLHTTLFPELRLVVEYQNPTSEPYLVLTVGNNNNSVTGTTQPILCADIILNQKTADTVLENFKSVIWSAVELDTVVVPQNVTNAKLRLQGFQNKTLTSLLVQKKPMAQESLLYKKTCSQFVFDEVTQIYANGSALFAENGVSRPSQRLRLLTDSFSTMNAIPCGANGAVYNAASIIDDPAQRSGKMDYLGCVINQKISSLDIDFSRRNVVLAGYNTDQYNQKLTLNCWGMVKKAIVKTKTGFAVMYV